MRNYGIEFCKKVLNDLTKIENEMFDKTGHGVDYFSRHAQTEREYTALLAKFRKERALGLSPSYDPSIHGGSN